MLDGFVCSIGGIFIYGLLQALLWCLFHVSIIFWGVVYPVNYQVTNNSGRMKYVHLTMVIVAATLPLILIGIYSMTGGFGPNLLLHYSCFPTNTTAAFYCFLIPLDIMVIICVVMLVIVFTKIGFEVSLF